MVVTSMTWHGDRWYRNRPTSQYSSSERVPSHRIRFVSPPRTRHAEAQGWYKSWSALQPSSTQPFNVL
jgi:hypothetical protein